MPRSAPPEKSSYLTTGSVNCPGSRTLRILVQSDTDWSRSLTRRQTWAKGPLGMGRSLGQAEYRSTGDGGIAVIRAQPDLAADPQSALSARDLRDLPARLDGVSAEDATGIPHLE